MLNFLCLSDGSDEIARDVEGSALEHRPSRESRERREETFEIVAKKFFQNRQTSNSRMSSLPRQCIGLRTLLGRRMSKFMARQVTHVASTMRTSSKILWHSTAKRHHVRRYRRVWRIDRIAC